MPRDRRATVPRCCTTAMGVLTHCNAGALAASEYGTALAVIYAAQAAGKRLHVYADETRPLLQGARLTAWELMDRGIDTTLICDSMAAQVMREGRVQVVITGADRIAANGDTANKIGTYAVAVLAHAHDIPFYVAAPCSTFDLTLASGDEIPIEQRDPREVTHGFGTADRARRRARVQSRVRRDSGPADPRPDHRTRHHHAGERRTHRGGRVTWDEGTNRTNRSCSS